MTICVHLDLSCFFGRAGNTQAVQGQLNTRCAEELGVASRDEGNVAQEMCTTGRGGGSSHVRVQCTGGAEGWLHRNNLLGSFSGKQGDNLSVQEGR